jgi:hypothetical protein
MKVVGMELDDDTERDSESDGSPLISSEQESDKKLKAASQGKYLDESSDKE